MMIQLNFKYTDKIVNNLIESTSAREIIFNAYLTRNNQAGRERGTMSSYDGCHLGCHFRDLRYKKRQLNAREQSSDYRPADKMPTHDIIDNREGILLK